MADEIMDIARVIIGFILLMSGGESLVQGAIRISDRLKVPKLLVGFTVVAIGTSLPELAVALEAVRQEAAEIAIGSVIGSNVANVGLVLALSAFIFPISLNYKLIKRDLWIYLISCAIFVLFSLDGRLSKFEGAFL